MLLGCTAELAGVDRGGASVGTHSGGIDPPAGTFGLATGGSGLGAHD